MKKAIIMKAMAASVIIMSALATTQAHALTIYDVFYGVVTKVSNVPKTYTYTNKNGSGYYFTNPVVIAGAPTYNGSDPGIARVSNVTTHDFTIRFGEWEYENDSHTGEKIPVIALAAGHRTMPDNSVWEANVVRGVSSSSNFTVARHVTFSQPFTRFPNVFLTSQTQNSTPFSLRVANVTTTGFDIYMQEEEAKQATGHGAEDIGYLAIQGYGSPGESYLWAQYAGVISGITYETAGSFQYYAGIMLMNHDWRAIDTPEGTFQFKLDEEKSLDTETYHSPEYASVLYISSPYDKELIFTQDYTYYDSDTFSIRRK